MTIFQLVIFLMLNLCQYPLSTPIITLENDLINNLNQRFPRSIIQPIQLDMDLSQEYSIQQSSESGNSIRWYLVDDKNHGYPVLFPNHAWIDLQNGYIPDEWKNITLTIYSDINRNGNPDLLISGIPYNSTDTYSYILEWLEGSLIVQMVSKDSSILIVEENGFFWLKIPYKPRWETLFHETPSHSFAHWYSWDLWRWKHSIEKQTVEVKTLLDQSYALMQGKEIFGDKHVDSLEDIDSLREEKKYLGLFSWLECVKLSGLLDRVAPILSKGMPETMLAVDEPDNASGMLDEIILQKKIIERLKNPNPEMPVWNENPTIFFALDSTYIRLDRWNGQAAFYDKTDRMVQKIFFPAWQESLENWSPSSPNSVFEPQVYHNNLWLFARSLSDTMVLVQPDRFYVYNENGNLITQQPCPSGTPMNIGMNVVFVQTLNESTTMPFLMSFFSADGDPLSLQLSNWQEYFQMFDPPIRQVNYSMENKRWISVSNLDHPSFFFLFDEHGQILQSPGNYHAPAEIPYDWVGGMPNARHPELIPIDYSKYYLEYNLNTNSFERELEQKQLRTRFDDNHHLLPFYVLSFRNKELLSMKKQFGILGDQTNEVTSIHSYYNTNGNIFKGIKEKEYFDSGNLYFRGISCHEYYNKDSQRIQLEIYGKLHQYSDRFQPSDRLCITLYFQNNKIQRTQYWVSALQLVWLQAEFKHLYIDQSEIVHSF